jgi:hypothetical protein
MIPHDLLGRKGSTPEERLAPNHLVNLRASGLSDEQILKCGFWTEMDAKAIAGFLNWKRSAKSLGPCLCIPFPNSDGSDTGYVRVKPDTPRTFNGKSAKYESPRESTNRLYLPPQTRQVLTEMAVVLLITEGEKKSAKADQDGFPCLGLTGVYNWSKPRPKDTGGKGSGPFELIDAFAAVNLIGRVVVIVYDSDAATNLSVRWAEYRLSESLKARGADVRAVRLPAGSDGTKIGLDDFLIQHGPDALRVLLESAKAVERPEDDRPVIVVGVDEHRVNDEASAALGRESDLFHRAGSLVTVERTVVTPDATATVRRSLGSASLRLLPQASVRERMARTARWVKHTETVEGVEYKPVHPPAWSAAAVYARSQWPKVRPLDALLSHPVLMPDGSLLTAPGYHADARLYLDLHRLGNVVVPVAATFADVKSAVATLFEVLVDFPFESPAHKAAWLAGLLTPLAWFLFDGPAPLFLIDANVRAAGKGLLCDVIALILTGRRFPVMTYTPDREELRKRITSLAAEGERLVLLDNLAGAVGNDVLDAALTTDRWKDRILGTNRVYDGQLHVTWFATGNNVLLAADTARRVCHVRLETPLENPENRSGFRVSSDLRRHVLARRGELLSAALTILKGWHAAGRPRTGLKPWGSYEGWSEVVREAVVFAGLPDPGETRMALQTAADRDAGAMATVLHCLERLDPDRRGVTAADVVDKLKNPPAPAPDWYADLRAALEELCGGLDTRRIGGRFRAFARRVFAGRFLDKAGTDARAVRWAVFSATEFNRTRPKPTQETHQTHPTGEGESGESNESPPAGPADAPTQPQSPSRPRRYANDDRGGLPL